MQTYCSETEAKAYAVEMEAVMTGKTKTWI